MSEWHRTPQLSAQMTAARHLVTLTRWTWIYLRLNFIVFAVLALVEALIGNTLELNVLRELHHFRTVHQLVRRSPVSFNRRRVVVVFRFDLDFNHGQIK